MEATSLVYVTTADAQSAKKLGSQAVHENLAACANVIPGMSSVYEWKGEICEDSECVLLLKTRSQQVNRLTERIRELHDYECPCVVELAIHGGNEEFISWIATETQ